MIKVAFLLNFPLGYKGGINYFKNLFYAVSKADASKLEICLFVPSDIGSEYLNTFSPYAKIIKTSILKRKNLAWFADKISEKVFSSNFLLNRLLKKHNIDVVSHSNYVSKYHSFTVLNWIPDFQSLHFPYLWERAALQNNYVLNRKIIKLSDRVILSSYNALKDFNSFSDIGSEKVRVLQFVSQPETIDSKKIKESFDIIKNKYNLNTKFFYLPNQFWQHKNHIVVFKALKILKDKGIEVVLVTSGQLVDYRVGEAHLQMLRKFIADNELENNIILLGLIPYIEVLILMRCCKALINPSLFEGWSSTVEEAKSIGQTIVLSDIEVHREQNPPKGLYFAPLDYLRLAEILADLWTEDVDNHPDTQWYHNQLVVRTKKFGQQYIDIVLEATGLNLMR